VKPSPTLTFLGAAGTVTGSKHLLAYAGRRVLLDCGLFQGLKALRLRNWAPPAIDPRSVDAVVLSHAHVDHSGALPLFVRLGFRGPIYATPPTQDLLRILLLDAAHLQEEEAAAANRYGHSKHHPALPLFTAADAEAALARVVPMPFGTAFPVVPGAAARFRRAGHILGAATVEVVLGGTEPATLVYSGDLGRPNRPLLHDPEPAERADVLLVESTYGDRVHAPAPEEALARVVREAADRGGALLIPAFAVGRTQELLWHLRALEEAGEIPALPVYVDSPMAVAVTEVYARHRDEHDEALRAAIAAEGERIRRRVKLIRRVEDSKALNDVDGPMIVIAGSGMATGGRILHHLTRRLPDPRTTVLLPGFQAAGTRGRSLQDGARTLRMFGRDVPVRARVVVLDGLSAHADREELLAWLRHVGPAPAAVHVVHGEPPAAEALAAAIRSRLGWPSVAVAVDGATVPVRR
jgi:metallo-beta-lactamase family protein